MVPKGFWAVLWVKCPNSIAWYVAHALESGGMAGAHLSPVQAFSNQENFTPGTASFFTKSAPASPWAGARAHGGGCRA